MTAAQQSPWYYRHRGLCIGAIFWLSFATVPLGGLVANIGFGHAMIAVISAAVPGFPNAGLWSAALFCTLAFAVRLWGASYLGQGVVMTRETVKSALTIAGPYRFTRNPLYFGNVLLAIGAGLFGPWIALVTATLGMVLFSYALIAVEERDLRATFGDRFMQYAKSVPRLFPTPWPNLPDLGTAKPSFLTGLRTELFISAGFAAITIAFAVLGKVDGITALVAFAVVWVAGGIVRTMPAQKSNG